MNLRAWLPDPPGGWAYQIVTYTWLICHRRYKDPKVAVERVGLVFNEAVHRPMESDDAAREGLDHLADVVCPR